MKKLIEKLRQKKTLERAEYTELLTSFDDEVLDYANRCARNVSIARFGKEIYVRGLIELTNFCRNNCYYCGIRSDNRNVERYRLTPEQVIDCCRFGNSRGIKTFVLQGGEDPGMKKTILETVKMIRKEFPDVAITLSLGEWDDDTYRTLFEAGANRYLLRHEAASAELYASLHPENMIMQHRMGRLRTLKDIGYQTGAGMMVGCPGQTPEHLVEDLLFLENFRPHMIGIGPFVPQHNTPFASASTGRVDTVLMLVSMVRLMFPDALIPATTALATVAENGYERGILAGANVVMPNLLSAGYKSKYAIYDGKACIGLPPNELVSDMKRKTEAIGYMFSTKRGDYRLENY